MNRMYQKSKFLITYPELSETIHLMKKYSPIEVLSVPWPGTKPL